jgi:hypothetical protein
VPIVVQFEEALHILTVVAVYSLHPFREREKAGREANF